MAARPTDEDGHRHRVPHHPERYTHVITSMTCVTMAANTSGPGAAETARDRGHHLQGGDDMGERTCSVDGCDRGGKLIRGWCSKHYQRWKAHGDPTRIADVFHDGAVCAVDECERPAISREWCSLHYQRWSKTGDPVGKLTDGRPTECAVDGCARPIKSNGLCDAHIQRQRRNGEPGPAEIRPVFQWPFSLLNRMHPTPTGCIEFSGPRTPDGYGKIRVRYRHTSAHRAAYELFVGPIPEGLHIDHLCRNTSCVNPAHLEPVTPSENNRRMQAAKRAAS